MKKELQERLKSKYVNLFKVAEYSERLTPIVRGIECDDGWYDLIDETCDKLVKAKEDIRFTQVKEKLAGLTIHVDSWNDKVKKILQESNRKSFEICEVCGNSGGNYCIMKNGAQLKTLCKKHRESMGFVRKKKPMIINLVWKKT